MNKIDEIYELTHKHRELYSAVFELTTCCNWRCKHCYIPEHIEKGLSLEQINEVFDELRENGLFEITLTGGEIFARNDILEIIKLARNHFFKVILFSNISLLDEEKIVELSNLGVAEVSCTVFSLDEKIHDEITGVNGSLQMVLKNLMLLKKHGLKVVIKSIIMKDNANEWRELYEFCEKNGFRFMIDHDVFIKRDGTTSPYDCRVTREQFKRNCKEYDMLRNFKPRQHDENEYVCGGIQNAIFIDSKGVVYPCNKFLLPLGNLFEEKLEDIWNKSEVLKRIQEMRWKDLKKCNKCKKSAFCIHCPGTALAEDGSEYACSSLAEEKAEIRQEVYAL